MGHLHKDHTLLQALQMYVEIQPAKPLFHFVGDSGDVCDSLTYKELDAKSDNLANSLLSASGLGMSKGDRVLLVYPPSLDFMIAYIACLKAGVIAVPVFPPDPNRLKKDLQHFTTIQESCGATIALTSRGYNYAVKMASIKSLFTIEWPNMRWFETDTVFSSSQYAAFESVPHTIDDIAFLQYTSGSTSEPKGVMITHGNLAHNLQLIIAGLSADEETVVVSWLPQFHDMGLIGSYLGIIYCGGCGYYMSPFTFIRRPCIWVECMSRYRATHVQAPNFAYGLTARKYVSLRKEQRPPLDLSCVRHMINAAEPVDGVTIDTFYAVFEQCGLKRGVVYPTYGLAEHTVYVSSNGTQRLTVDRDQLETAGVVKEVDKMTLWAHSEREGRGGPEEGTKVAVLIGCGRPAESSGVDLRIVDLGSCTSDGGTVTGHSLPEDRVGEIWISSASCAAGYWSLAEKTLEDFKATIVGQEGIGYMRSGDLGFLHEGELFICGRLKDMMIVRGRNHFPQDIERTCEGACPSKLRGGCSAAFSVTTRGVEEMIVVSELKEDVLAPYESIADEMRRAILTGHGVSVSAIYLLQPRSIPKTTSGKIARAWCKKALVQGNLQIVQPFKYSGSTDADVHTGGFQASLEEDKNIDEDAVNPTNLPLEEIVTKIAKAVAEVLKVDPSNLATDVPLASLGIDSMDTFAVMGNLARKFTVSVPEEVLYEPDTSINTLAQVLRDGGVYHPKAIMVEAYRVLAMARELKLKSNKLPRLDEPLRRQLIADCTIKDGITDNYAQQQAPMSPADETLVMAFFLVVMSALFWVPISIIISCIYLPTAVTFTLWPTLLLFSALAPVRSWPPAGRFSRLGVALLKYFSYRVIYDNTLFRDDVPAMIAGYPHGVLPIGHILQILVHECLFGTNFHGVGASAIFMMPVYGHVFKMIGLEDASRANLEHVLGKKRRSIGLVPGGIAEMFTPVNAKPDEEVLVLKSRKGFIRLAIRTGAKILPCYLFGNTQIFRLVCNGFFAMLSRAVKASLTLFYGRYYLTIPFRVPILGVMGRPIYCVQMDNPPQEMVDEYHAMYVEEITRVFETYKGVYGWHNKKLVIT